MSTKVRITPDPGRHNEHPSELDHQAFSEAPLTQLRKVYVAFAQGLFQSAPSGYRWDPDDQVSEIYISDDMPVHAEVMQRRPAISFSRGPVQTINLGMDDMLSFDFQTGTKKKSLLVAGVMSIAVLSRVALESEQLAWVLSEQIWMNRGVFMRAGFYEMGRSFVVGAPSLAGSIVTDGGDEVYATMVSSPFQFHRTSQASPLGRLILEHINTQVLQGGRVDHRPLGPVSGPGNGSSHRIRYVDRAGNELALQPDPDNPTNIVKVQAAHPYQAGRRPTIYGRTIPFRR